MTARTVMDILPGKLFYVYIASLMAKRASPPNFVTVAYGSSSLTCIIHVRKDEPYILEKECAILTQWDKFNFEPTVKTFRYKPPDGSRQPVDEHSALK